MENKHPQPSSLMEDHFRKTWLNRSMPFLTEKGVETLKGKTVGIAGCGGVGGISAMTLARMGVGKFHLADPGKFDAPDSNRQWGASESVMGQLKVDVYQRWIQDINPYSKIKVFNEGIQPHTLDSFLDGVDLLIDCLDLSVSPSLRREMFRKARIRGIYSLTAPILGFGAVIFCSDPSGLSMDPVVDVVGSSQGDAHFPEILYRFFMPEHLDAITAWFKEHKTRVPSIAIGPLVASSVVATESLNILAGHCMPGGREPTVLPYVTFIDLFRMSYGIINASRLLKTPEEKSHAA